MSDKQLTGLFKTSQKKRQETLLKTEKAIAKLVDNQQKITVRSVAREAGVSVSYIYKYPELAYKIQTLREQQKYTPKKGDKNNLTRDNRLHTLEQQNSELKQELEDLKLHLNQLEQSDKTPSDLQQENCQLAIENAQLKKELQHTRKNLQEARDFILEQAHKNSLDEIKYENYDDIIPKVRRIKQK